MLSDEDNDGHAGGVDHRTARALARLETFATRRSVPIAPNVRALLSSGEVVIAAAALRHLIPNVDLKLVKELLHDLQSIWRSGMGTGTGTVDPAVIALFASG